MRHKNICAVIYITTLLISIVFYPTWYRILDYTFLWFHKESAGLFALFFAVTGALLVKWQFDGELDWHLTWWTFVGLFIILSMVFYVMEWISLNVLD